MITTHAKLSHYLTRLTTQLPIESRFVQHLADNLNAEIVLGSVSAGLLVCVSVTFVMHACGVLTEPGGVGG